MGAVEKAPILGPSEPKVGMRREVERIIRDVEFEFLNAKVRVQANCDYQALDLPGLELGPFKEGERYSLPLWAALELERKGIVKLIEAPELSVEELISIHSKETRIPKGLFELPSDFYPRLRMLLARVGREALKDPSKVPELRRVENMARDIVNARLKKLISLASSVARSPLTRRCLTPEEEFVFDLVGDIADTWREEVMGRGGANR